jgi:hypothetical protein
MSEDDLDWGRERAILHDLFPSMDELVESAISFLKQEREREQKEKKDDFEGFEFEEFEDFDFKDWEEEEKEK